MLKLSFYVKIQELIYTCKNDLPNNVFLYILTKLGGGAIFNFRECLLHIRLLLTIPWDEE